MTLGRAWPPLVVLAAVGAVACAPAGRNARAAGVGAPVTLVPRPARRGHATARLALSAGDAREAGTVELKPRGDSILEYSIRLKGLSDGAWAAAQLMYNSGREGARDEQVGSLFVGAALSPAAARVRGTVSVGRTIPVRWLVEELQANPARFFVVLTDSRDSGVTLRGQFR